MKAWLTTRWVLLALIAGFLGTAGGSAFVVTVAYLTVRDEVQQVTEAVDSIQQIVVDVDAEGLSNAVNEFGQQVDKLGPVLDEALMFYRRENGGGQ